MAQWKLVLQEFEFDIYHRPRIQHAVADYLRLELGEAGEGVKDYFLDGQLFRIDVVDHAKLDQKPEDK